MEEKCDVCGAPGQSICGVCHGYSPHREITDCFGETRISDPECRGFNWCDECPFCHNVSLGQYKGKCSNGWCDAAQGAKPDEVVARAHEAALEEERSRERKRIVKWSMKRIEEGNAARAKLQDEQVFEAKRRGACTNPKCLWPNYLTVKYVKHRNGCPKAR